MSSKTDFNLNSGEQKVIIRADATGRIGTGHVMRCLAFAQALKTGNYAVAFITVCESKLLNKRLLDEGFQVIPVVRSHPNPSDWQMTSKVLRSHPNAWVVLDGYHFDPEYQEQVRNAGHRLMVIDDYNHLDAYHADILLNQNIGSQKLTYSCNNDTVCLLGPQYALLRDEFLRCKRTIRGSGQYVRNALVTLGGADPDNIGLKVVRALIRTSLNNIATQVVAGPMNTATQTLQNEIDDARKAGLPGANGIEIVQNANMPELMANADIAVSSGGSTCWELCFFGIPFLVIIAADNQREIAFGLERTEAAICLGWHSEVTERQLQTQFETLVADTKRRQAMSANGRSLVDGKGRSRVLKEVNLSYKLH